MAKRGYRSLSLVYLNDFFIIGPTYAECQEIFNCLVELLQESGFQIRCHKVVPPTQDLIFLGILINSVSQTLELPQDKLVALQDLVEAFLHWHRASKRQLQSLAGKHSWACRVVYGGEPFCAVSLMSWTLCCHLLPGIVFLLSSMLTSLGGMNSSSCSVASNRF